MSKKINLNTSEKIIPNIKNAEKELRTLCEKRAIELYGEIPAIIVKQLEWEINLLKASNDLTLMLILGRVLRSDEIEPYMIKAIGNLSASVVSFLLNITKANPLSPHYYCECGEYYDFDTAKYNVSVGADLPSKLCPICGKKLTKDGFNLHNEFLFGINGLKTISFEIKVPNSKKEKIIKFIEDMPEVGAVINKPEHLVDLETKLHNGCLNQMFILPKEISVSYILDVPAMEGVSLLDKCCSFRIYGDDTLDYLINLSEITNTHPDDIAFNGTDILHRFLNVENNKNIINKRLRNIIDECNPITISDCIKTQAISYNDVWESIGKKLIKNKIVNLDKLPATQEDVYERLIEAGIDKALSYDMTKAVCSLIYLNKKYGKIAVKYKLPKWFIDFCNNVKFLFPRAHIAEGFIYTSKFEYYRHNYPEAFEKVCFEIENGVLKVYK